MSFNSLGDLLKGSAKKRGLGRQVEAAMILEFFIAIVRQQVGDAAANNMKPLYVRDNTLVVAVLSPVIAQELKLHENHLLRALNDKIGREGAVTSLRFLS